MSIKNRDEDEHRWIFVLLEYGENALNYDDILVIDKGEVLKFGSGTMSIMKIFTYW